MAVLEPPVRRPTERCLQCETIDQREFLPHDNAGSGFSGLLNHEVAGVKFKIFVVFAEQKREDPLLQSVRLLVRTPVHEQILSA